MSQGNEQLDVATAAELIQQEIVRPAFFEKLAAYGIEPQTEEEAVTLLGMGQHLLVSNPIQQAKSASANRFAGAYHEIIQANQPSLGEQILGWSEHAVSQHPVLAKAAEVLIEVDNVLAAGGA